MEGSGASGRHSLSGKKPRTNTVPVDMVWGPTMPIPFPCSHRESEDSGLGPLTAVACVCNSGPLCCCSNGLWLDRSALRCPALAAHLQPVSGGPHRGHRCPHLDSEDTRLRRGGAYGAGLTLIPPCWTSCAPASGGGGVKWLLFIESESFHFTCVDVREAGYAAQGTGPGVNRWV